MEILIAHRFNIIIRVMSFYEENDRQKNSYTVIEVHEKPNPIVFINPYYSSAHILSLGLNRFR